MARQQGTSEDNSVTHIFIAGSVVFLGFIGYHFFAVYINRVYAAIMHFELSVFGMFSHNATALKNQLMHTDVANISFSGLMSLNNQVGLLLRLPAAITLGCLIFAVMLLHPKKLFNVYYDMAKLAKKMVNHFKHITPVIDEHLEQTSSKEGVWASALSSSDFINQYGLYDNDSKIDDNKLEQQLIKQLGQRFSAFDSLSIEEQILFTVFALRVAGKDAKAQSLLEKASTNNIDHKALNILSQSVLKHPEVSAICQKHAYVRTLLCGLLVKARSTGILATASFLWLKTKDRMLWYTLNNVGRQAMFIEGAAAYSHWQTEHAIGFKVDTPLLEQLIKTIKDQQTNNSL